MSATENNISSPYQSKWNQKQKCVNYHQTSFLEATQLEIDKCFKSSQIPSSYTKISTLHSNNSGKSYHLSITFGTSHHISKTPYLNQYHQKERQSLHSDMTVAHETKYFGMHLDATKSLLPGWGWVGSVTYTQSLALLVITNWQYT